MVTYKAKKGCSDIYSVNFDTKEFDTVRSINMIDYCYSIDEDGELLIEGKDPIQVKKGDMVIRLYSISDNYEDKEFVVASCPELLDYSNRYKAQRNESKKESNGPQVMCCSKSSN